jgi:hypothetical protein
MATSFAAQRSQNNRDDVRLQITGADISPTIANPNGLHGRVDN